MPLRVFALLEAMLVPQKALVLSVAWALEVSVLIEITSHEANLALKVVNFVPLRALASLEVILVPLRALALIAGALALDSALTSSEA